MNTPRIVRMADPDGRPVVYVEMTNCLGVFAIIDEADYDSLTQQGVTSRWFLNKPGRNQPGYVRAFHGGVRGEVVTIARLILNAGAGEIVGYANGHRYDLRRPNLVLGKGRAKRRTDLSSNRADDFAPASILAPATAPPPPLPHILDAGPFPSPGDYRWDFPNT